MCKLKKYHKTSNTQIDKCIRRGINTLSRLLEPTNFRIIACCCGHNKYPMTIVIKLRAKGMNPYPFELFSGKVISRRRRFYKKDKKGYYYIKEVSEPKN